MLKPVGLSTVLHGHPLWSATCFCTSHSFFLMKFILACPVSTPWEGLFHSFCWLALSPLYRLGAAINFSGSSPRLPEALRKWHLCSRSFQLVCVVEPLWNSIGSFTSLLLWRDCELVEGKAFYLCISSVSFSGSHMTSWCSINPCRMEWIRMRGFGSSLVV